ncbi:J domain-containing protein [Evansella cellulosilytica]|uniref:Heat shock protein DnaJ domain protein n=1 Tax=Evansella cellulosilytica (strain ATCC 21833 / DSM 2522 / FERM P-1141 / JCM 9156 / N-4) TaxID=649639 RepID=E6TT42_EVAC2|nr:DnaJ domain-containing protein [Evansella cellulosilytica]ADU31950.1 heat shock protein DnaJ domain protein [Evansella cellulosilytica DSM 2522]
MNENMSYYEILGVEPSTPSSDIRKAYVRKIRQYPNETHPKEFQLIRKAYEVLSDESQRAAYDSSGQNDDEYERLFSEAMAMMNNGKYYQASNLFNDIIVRYPGDRVARYYKALSLIEINSSDKALAIAKQLLIEDPNNVDYMELTVLAHEKEKNHDQAIRLLEKLIDRYPEKSEYYLRLSNIFVDTHQYTMSARTLEKKLIKGETIQDFPLLQELFFIYYLDNSYEKGRRVLYRLRNLPQNENERQQMLDWLMDTCDGITPRHHCYDDLVELIRTVNASQYQVVNNWLRQADAAVQTAATSAPVYNETYNQPNNHNNTTTYNQSGTVDDGRGSVFAAVVIGIIASLIFTPFVGIIIGFVYYYNARLIKTVVGCLVGIIIFIIFVMLIAL